MNVSKLPPDNDIIDSDPPIFFDQRKPCDHNQVYVNPNRFGCVGFRAGTLADMGLTLPLHMQLLFMFEHRLRSDRRDRGWSNLIREPL